MECRAKVAWIAGNGALVVLVVCALIWLTAEPDGEQPATGQPTGDVRPAGPPIRIGLIPERDVFKQRQRYRAMADYLDKKLNRRIELFTLNTYEAVLARFAARDIEGAFLGSLVAVLAMDRMGVEVIAKPQSPAGTGTYRGVLFVRADSPVKALEQIRDHSIGMVRTTTAGHLFPGCVLMRMDLLNDPGTRIVWIGTHDDVVNEVLTGRVDVGAVKDLRLDAILREHPEWKIRRLATSHAVPDNGLLLRSDVAKELGADLKAALLGMDADPAGREALSAMGLERFLPCEAREYSPVYRMVERIGPAWREIGVPGPAPRRPADWPKPDPAEIGKCCDVNY